MKKEIDILFMLVAGQRTYPNLRNYSDDFLGFDGEGLYQRLTDLQKRVDAIDGKTTPRRISMWDAIGERRKKQG